MRKRTTKKTGNFTKSTTTLSSTRGRTQSSSFRAPGGATRRTVSFNDGKMRTTYTTHHGGGWSTTKSKTVTLSGKPKTSTSKRRSSSSRYYSSGENVTWWDMIKAIIGYGLLWLGGLIVVIIFLLIIGI